MHTDFLFIILLCIVTEIGFDIIIIPIIQIIRYADVRRGKPAASRVIFRLSLGAGSDGLGLGAVSTMADRVAFSVDFSAFKGPFPGGAAFSCS